MSYTSQLQFVQNLLRKMNISSYIAENPELRISREIDLGLRALLFGEEDYSLLLHNSMSAAKPNTIYRFFDEYYCHYIFMKLPATDSERYFFIGPYLFQAPPDDLLQTKYCSLSEDVRNQLKQYYASLPTIENENLLLTIASTLGQTLWGSQENYLTEYIEYVIPDREQPVPIILQRSENTGQKFPLDVLERNYSNEKLLMDAVSQGKLHKVNVIASTVFNNGTEARLTDSLRNRKNYLIILKTLLRKAAEQGGVHPVHIDKTTSYYANKIENLHSVKESFPLQEEMIREFCLLVKHHSLNKYSYVVGRAITLINYDILANLSLKGISEQLNVSPSYLSGRFKKECGCTLTDYINKTRIEQAFPLLHNGDLQIQAIAYECGFQDPNYFIRIFKKHTGMSPGQYRKHNK